ncbi:SRPBCC domain-containing protein [Adhaeribacter swui]|uniref:SRPBCC domain-containing protein n=1 Tax=Adhaeribacter swui TaxID=2086471 RepID=A0A7G7G9Z9_9BACT|nr:SRPBCC domain-containing protein [Adhaeribacter swui]QNF33983.1 SRPBCC domain-containing protein [Adhaeribacter swui]
METQVLKDVIELNAPTEKVWQVLTQDEYNRQWYAEFMEGTYAETDWQEGSKALFKDKTECGIVAKIIANQPHQLLSLVYQGIVNNGQEDYSSPEAEAVKGGREIYRLVDLNGRTRLEVEADMGAEYLEMMQASWNRAFQKIKELAEN